MHAKRNSIETHRLKRMANWHVFNKTKRRQIGFVRKHINLNKQANAERLFDAINRAGRHFSLIISLRLNCVFRWQIRNEFPQIIF